MEALVSPPDDLIAVRVLKIAVAHLVLILEVWLEFPVRRFGVASHTARILSGLVIGVDLGNAVGSSGFDLKLNCTGALHKGIEKGSFVNGFSYGLDNVSTV